MTELTYAESDATNPYDELPYRSRPVEWMAPEHLALVSLLHGGPRTKLAGYRVLELGCGDGTNLLPLAYYRPHAHFVGVDSSRRAIARAEARRDEVGLSNLQFLHADFGEVASALDRSFDYILVHGVFSWVPQRVRDQLLSLCAAKLAPDGLLYLNYNSKPGWNVRGMVRDFLRARTAHIPTLAAQAHAAHEIAINTARALEGVDHPYSQLMEREYRFVAEGHPSYVAHEFLSAENHAYWHSEFLELVAPHGLTCLGDADYCHASGRTPAGLAQAILAAGLEGPSMADTVDMLCYRQMHSPILSHRAVPPRECTSAEFSRLFLASSLTPSRLEGPPPWSFVHSSGHEVEVSEPEIREALRRLSALWPRAVRLDTLFSQMDPWMADLRLLATCGMTDLRISEPEQHALDPRFSAAEQSWTGAVTTPLHRQEA